MSPFDPSRFVKGNTCLPCCASGGACSCGLLFPVFDTPYASYADAVTGIADSVYGCFAFYRTGGDGGAGNLFTATFDGTTLAVTHNAAVAGGAPGIAPLSWFSIAMKAGAVLSGVFTFSADGFAPPPAGVTMELRKCADNSVAATAFSSSGAGTLTVTAPADGEYYLLLEAQGGLFPSFVTSTWSVTSSAVWTVNQAIALWDDSGTTRSLWACPKLLLPPLTEVTGDWYASCADAHAVLADPLQVSNCVGYAAPNASTVSNFTATDGGGSLTLDILVTAPAAALPGMWGSVNAIAGQTLTATFTNDATTPDVQFNIFDDTGAVVENLTGASPLASSPLPYTGRYTFVCLARDTTPFPGSPTLTTASFVITSSGAMSVNPIQARYDLGLDCPGALNCGDACP